MEYLNGHDVRLFVQSKNLLHGCSARKNAGYQYPIGGLSAIACATDCMLEMKADEIDVIGMPMDYDNILSGKKSWTIETSHLAMLEAYGDIDAFSLMDKGEKILVVITRSVGKTDERDSESHYNSKIGNVRVGYAIITNIRESYPLRGCSTYKVTFKGTGPMVTGKRLITGKSGIVETTASLKSSLLNYGFAMNYNNKIEIYEYTPPSGGSGSIGIPEVIGTKYSNWNSSQYYESASVVNSSGTIFIDDDLKIFTWNETAGKFTVTL